MEASVDYIKLFKRATPWFLRKTKLMDFLNSIGNVLKGINNDFVAFYNKIDYKLSITNQKIYMEKYLNDIYDPVGKGIFIETLELNANVYVFNKEELKPLYLYNSNPSAWAPSTAYVVYDEVSINDKTYVCIQAHTSAASFNPNYFKLVSVYLFNQSELSSAYNYVIYIPSSITYNLAKITAEINTYNPVGKLWRIQTY